jgi:hypothetical protein
VEQDIHEQGEGEAMVGEALLSDMERLRLRLTTLRARLALI